MRHLTGVFTREGVIPAVWRIGCLRIGNWIRRCLRRTLTWVRIGLSRRCIAGLWSCGGIIESVFDAFSWVGKLLRSRNAGGRLLPRKRKLIRRCSSSRRRNSRSGICTLLPLRLDRLRWIYRRIAVFPLRPLLRVFIGRARRQRRQGRRWRRISLGRARRGSSCKQRAEQNHPHWHETHHFLNFTHSAPQRAGIASSRDDLAEGTRKPSILCPTASQRWDGSTSIHLL